MTVHLDPPAQLRRHTERWRTSTNVPGDPSGGQTWRADGKQVRLLLREVLTPAGGWHDELDEYGRVKAEQPRVVVAIEPTRVYGDGTDPHSWGPGGAESGSAFCRTREPRCACPDRTVGVAIAERGIAPVIREEVRTR